MNASPWADRAHAILDRLRSLPVIGVGIDTFMEALRDGAKDSAASIAYFAFFSMFPLLLALVAAAGFAIEPSAVRMRIDELLVNAMPGSAVLVGDVLDAVTRLRGPATILSAAALLWSASAAFGAVSRVINRAWGTQKSHPFYISKLSYVGMCFAVALLFVLSATVTALVEVVVGFNLPLLDPLGLSEAVARLSSRAFSFSFLLMMFGLLYKVMPRQKTLWREVWPGALLAAVLLEAAKAFFVGYLDNVANLEAVYGSLSSVIILLLWLYVSAWILILGAEFIYVRRERATAEAS